MLNNHFTVFFFFFFFKVGSEFLPHSIFSLILCSFQNSLIFHVAADPWLLVSGHCYWEDGGLWLPSLVYAGHCISSKVPLETVMWTLDSSFSLVFNVITIPRNFNTDALGAWLGGGGLGIKGEDGAWIPETWKTKAFGEFCVQSSMSTMTFFLRSPSSYLMSVHFTMPTLSSYPSTPG